MNTTAPHSTKSARGPLAWLRKAALAVWVGFTVLVAASTIFSAYAGDIDPERMPFAGGAAMTFALWWVLSVLCLLVSLACCRLLALVPAVALISTIGPFLTFCPLHCSPAPLTQAEKERSFSILSYNILSFVDQQPELSTEDSNRTMRTVLDSDADLLCLLEYGNQGPLKNFVPQHQIDSLFARYPYKAVGQRGTVAFSKTPVLHIALPRRELSRGSLEAFRTVIDGHPIVMFAVHMESIGLKDHDRTLFRDVTSPRTLLGLDVNKGQMQQVRSQLILKLYDAFKNRAWQALFLKDYIEQMQGNVVVCGDFNDVPGCRALKILESAGLQDAYAELGCGPTITYNASHFLFRIDHVLYKGDFKAHSIVRGDVPSSDHYPFLTTFVWDE